ncbi:unnamed protein product [Cyberlindnera jadinii]|uniref:Uncharacterized protein n=1 Tax=Cyberlindnera jadinii (strain ATCC 18201 / CBS 1600 / BCRC 20928 / JCM 3617 / NBRC 0987 / NRRL Y-1542) TaxID=983966 RepID=A0A0H5C9X0_CYBJN|nr:unnamed protein product [Cyberlindnera jadinii]
MEIIVVSSTEPHINHVTRILRKPAHISSCNIVKLGQWSQFGIAEFFKMALNVGSRTRLSLVEKTAFLSDEDK